MGRATACTSRPDGLAALLADLVSEPRLDRVLAKIADHARAALDGAQVALLLCGPGGPACQAPCPLPPPMQRALERWTGSEPEVPEAPVLLAGSAASEALGLPVATSSSLCAAPMRYGERRLGTLVAVEEGGSTLGAVELSTLEAFAAAASAARPVTSPRPPIRGANASASRWPAVSPPSLRTLRIPKRWPGRALTSCTIRLTTTLR